MNWLASLTAAVIVLAGGVAVGAAIGGKNAKTHTVTEPVSASGSASAPGTPGTGTQPTAPAARSVPVAGLHWQVKNIDASNVSTPGLADLNGRSFQNSLVIDQLFIDCNSNAATKGIAWISFPVSAGLARFKGTIGLNSAGQKTEPSFTMTVEVRKDLPNGQLLRTARVYNGTGTVEGLDFQLRGARQLLFVFRGQQSDVCSGDPGFATPRDSEFVFANATLTR